MIVIKLRCDSHGGREEGRECGEQEYTAYSSVLKLHGSNWTDYAL